MARTGSQASQVVLAPRIQHAVLMNISTLFNNTFFRYGFNWSQEQILIPNDSRIPATGPYSFWHGLKKVLPVPRGLLLLGTDIVVTRSHLLATGYPAKVTWRMEPGFPSPRSSPHLIQDAGLFFSLPVNTNLYSSTGLRLYFHTSSLGLQHGASILRFRSDLQPRIHLLVNGFSPWHY